MRYTEYAEPNLLQLAYHCYRRNNLVISQRAFSRRILGKPPSYYSCMITRNRTPSVSVLETLLSVTKTILASFIGNPHLHKSYAENLNQAHDQLQELVERITIELELMNAVQNMGA